MDKMESTAVLEPKGCRMEAVLLPGLGWAALAGWKLQGACSALSSSPLLLLSSALRTHCGKSILQGSTAWKL